MLQLIFGGISPDIALNFGTANTLVYAKNRGVILSEPSYIAIHDQGKETGKVAGVGAKARELSGRTSARIKSSSPLRSGVIHNFEHAQVFLKYIFDKVQKKSHFMRSKVVIAIPAGVTPVEERALVEAATASGAGDIYLIEESIVSALGAGLPVMEACGSMIVDLGAGTSTVSVLSLGGIVRSEITQTAGNSLDRKIIEYVRRIRRAIIGEHTAEEVKIAVGAAAPTNLSSGVGPTLEVQGRDLTTGLPTSLTLSEQEILPVLSEPLTEICRLIQRVLEKTPPEMSADIAERGLVLVGGGSLLKNIDLWISECIGIPVSLVEDPLTTAVVGSGKILEEWSEYSRLLSRVM